MTNKQIFIKTVEELIAHSSSMIPSEAMQYLETLKATQEKEKPMFTENGAKVLQWMQDNYTQYNNVLKAKEIAEGLFLPSSRTVSGAIRKLITDGYVEKISGTPVCYSLTETGMTIEVVMPEKHETEEA
jgi:Mn-dependent DtxR family transcriptional regulator